MNYTDTHSDIWRFGPLAAGDDLSGYVLPQDDLEDILRDVERLVFGRN